LEYAAFAPFVDEITENAGFHVTVSYTWKTVWWRKGSLWEVWGTWSQWNDLGTIPTEEELCPRYS